VAFGVVVLSNGAFDVDHAAIWDCNRTLVALGVESAAGTSSVNTVRHRNGRPNCSTSVGLYGESTVAGDCR
jgi:hypothetical protein